MATFEIPLSPRPQRMKIALAGVAYLLRFYFANTDGGGWLLDISSATGAPLICGIPLVTGVDLLAPYAYVGIGGKLFVRSDSDPGAVPTFTNLGVGSHVYFSPNS